MPNPKKNKTNSFERTLTLDIQRADKEKSVIPVTISTETPVDTWSGKEILNHSKSAVNLTRASKMGLPLLFNHGASMILGRVKNIVLKSKKLMGELVFSRSDQGQQFFNDVLDEIITDVSVGGTKEVIEPHEFDGDQYGHIVQRWTPLEVSLVGIPADENSGINRQKKEVQGMDVKAKEQIEQGRKLELTRQKEIRFVFRTHKSVVGVDALLTKCIDDDETLERSRELLLELIGKTQEPVKKDAAPTFIHGESEPDKFKTGITRALELRVGIASEEVKKDAVNNHYTSFNPVEMARAYLNIAGINTQGMSRHQVVGAAFTRGNIFGSATSSDFPNILADVANKALLIGFNETDETWQEWCKVGNLADFKEAMRVNLSEFDNLDEIPEGGEYSHGEFGDLAEKIKLLTYGKLFTITRQALINDDLSALSRIPTSMGRAAARKVGDLAYGVLISNPEMNEDGEALFSAAHNNDTSLGAPEMTIIDQLRVIMALQKGSAEHASLGIRPAFAIVPLQVEGTMRELMTATYNPDGTAGTLRPNIVKNLMSVVGEHRLSEDDAAQYYLAANPAVADTIEVAFLDGNSAPYLEQQEGFTRDGVSHKVRIDAAAGAMGWRGLIREAGTEAE